MKTSSKILSTSVIVVAVGFLVFWYQNKESLINTQVKNIETVQLPETNKIPEEKVLSSSTYKDGEYKVITDYMAPSGKESLGIDVNIQNDKVISLSVKNMAENKVSANYQNKFIAGIQSVTIGQNINSLKVGVVSGASLTSNGFNTALANIKAQAKVN